jgi:hypothetical protein
MDWHSDVERGGNRATSLDREVNGGANRTDDVQFVKQKTCPMRSTDGFPFL